MPSWLKQIPGMHPRSATQPYMNVTYNWMHQHIEYVRPYFAENGGPIIMTQSECRPNSCPPCPMVMPRPVLCCAVLPPLSVCDDIQTL